ncbi:hypothetical protein [Stappia sp. TSB10P1A]|uniref:hypothetical protein n=1 Tax=Stappia sp. TSB10P1A TaxID=2003585 RepID=UPI001643A859|nr:hypothetical protein [Stappia sp. TSB10P1A]
MMYWDTGDSVVDCILQKIEILSDWKEDSDASQVQSLLVALIDIERMLPQAVSRHFKIPHLFVGDAHFTGGDEYRRRLVSNITNAVKEGLGKATADPLLQRNGGAVFDDRPRSRGEEILDAIDTFESERTISALLKLKTATSPTRLQSRVKSIEMLMNRKRPYGNQDPEVAMLGELYRLRQEAKEYHSQMA